jgi:hypothetical protein
MGQRKAVTTKLAAVYRRGSRAGKTKILDELVELSEQNASTRAGRAAAPGRVL